MEVRGDALTLGTRAQEKLRGRRLVTQPARYTELQVQRSNLHHVSALSSPDSAEDKGSLREALEREQR